MKIVEVDIFWQLNLQNLPRRRLLPVAFLACRFVPAGLNLKTTLGNLLRSRVFVTLNVSPASIVTQWKPPNIAEPDDLIAADRVVGA